MDQAAKIRKVADELWAFAKSLSGSDPGLCRSLKAASSELHAVAASLEPPR